MINIWSEAVVLGFQDSLRGESSQLLTLDEKEPKRLFEGNALIRRLVRVGVLDESRMKLDYVLALKVEDFLERRLQTCVYKLGLAKSIHHARVLIRQRHIRYVPGAGNQRSYKLIRTVLENRSSMFLPSLFVSTPRSILTLPLHHHSAEDVRAVSGARRLELPRRRKRGTVERKKRSRSKISETAGTWLHPVGEQSPLS